MANSIVDDVILRLVDLRELFQRMPPDALAELLSPVILRVGNELARDLLERVPWTRVAAGGLASDRFNTTLLPVGQRLLADFVRQVQREPERFFNLRGLVVRGVSDDPKVLVQLFEKCGARDLRFVQRSCLFVGGLLGVLRCGSGECGTHGGLSRSRAPPSAT